MTAPNTGVAYDAAYPNIAAILAKRPLYVDCYTDGAFAYSRAVVAQIHAAGSGVKWNHERAVTELTSGAAGGTTAANAAVAAVLAAGTPTNAGVAIYYSVDLNAPLSSFGAYGEAFDAINRIHAGRFLAGVYGEGALIDYLTSTRRIQVKGWLSASSSFPGYNRNSLNVGEYQLVGSDVASTDKNIVTDASHMGIWWPNGLAPLGSGALIEGSFLMALSDADQAQLFQHVNALYDVTFKSTSDGPAGLSIVAYLTGLIDRLLDTPIPRVGTDEQGAPLVEPITLRKHLAWVDENTIAGYRKSDALAAGIEALATGLPGAVAAKVAPATVDPAAVAASLVGLKGSLTFTGS